MSTSAKSAGWALVTGASDGIGVEFCKQLAGRGYDLVLVARREEKLREVAETMSARHGVRCLVVPCDLSKAGAAEEVHRRTAELGAEIDFLVNNAGLLFNGFFDEIDRHGQEDLLAVNVLALTSLTHLFLKDMLARGRGRILNVASLAAWIGIPQQNVYAASKAYVLSFSLALHDEVQAKNPNVVVTALCPGYTDTKMLDNPAQGPKLEVPRASVLAADFVAAEGVEACLAGKAISIPGLGNRIGIPLLQALPRTWVTKLTGILYRRGQS